MNKLFSIQTEIGGKTVAIEVDRQSNLNELGRYICQHYNLSSDHENHINKIVVEELKNILESEQYDLEWKYEICTLLEDFLEDIVDKNTTSYFKSNPRRHTFGYSEPHSRHKLPTSYLYEKALKLKEKKLQMQEYSQLSKDSRELEGCTFHPAINCSSSNTYRKRRLEQNNIYDVLYHDAKKINNKKKLIKAEAEKELSELTFKPVLNPCSILINQIKGRVDLTQPKTPKNIKNEYFSFRPKISKESYRLARQFPSFWRRIQLENGVRPKEYPRRKTPAKENRDPQLNKHSVYIYERKKFNQFKSIFEQLEIDGLVDAESIEHNKCLLLKVHQDIIQPLFEEIENLYVQLNQQYFIESLNVLYQNLSPLDKNILISHNIKAKWDDEHSEYLHQYSFKPVVSQKKQQKCNTLEDCFTIEESMTE